MVNTGTIYEEEKLVLPIVTDYTGWGLGEMKLDKKFRKYHVSKWRKTFKVEGTMRTKTLKVEQLMGWKASNIGDWMQCSFSFLVSRDFTLSTVFMIIPVYSLSSFIQ